MPTELIYKNALLPSGWERDVAVGVNDNGDIENIRVGVAGGKNSALIPGLANLHSHAHQRAMAGLAERSGSGDDSFWTWRKTMYEFLEAIQPHHLHAIAAQLYLELVSSGYTRVAEFQYLHHQPNGKQYENAAEMSLQTIAAAQLVGIGITSLPVHYQFGGFGEQGIAEQQKRFFNKPDDFLKIVEQIRNSISGNVDANYGIAGHSLRATSKSSFGEILGSTANLDIPIHMHIAEQIKEIKDCLAWSGATPVDYCLTNFDVNKQWCLIHATHMTEAETICLANSGAVAGLCPTTEANLGDGFFNTMTYMEAGGTFGIGSDSHISTSPTEELRWFEYGQRLLKNSRNQLAGGYLRSTGRNLFDTVAKGGVQACGHNAGAIEVGLRADFVVLDTNHPILVGREGDELLDSWIFSGNRNAIKDVFVGGRQVIKGGRHRFKTEINRQFKTTMHEIRQAI